MGGAGRCFLGCFFWKGWRWVQGGVTLLLPGFELLPVQRHVLEDLYECLSRDALSSFANVPNALLGQRQT